MSHECKATDGKMARMVDTICWHQHASVMTKPNCCFRRQPRCQIPHGKTHKQTSSLCLPMMYSKTNNIIFFYHFHLRWGHYVTLSALFSADFRSIIFCALMLCPFAFWQYFESFSTPFLLVCRMPAFPHLCDSHKAFSDHVLYSSLWAFFAFP